MPKAKNKIKNAKKSSLSLAVKPEDVFQTDKSGRLWLGETVLTDQEIKNLRQEVSFIRRSKLWSIFQSTLTDMAKLKMFEKSTCWEDMTYGKAMLYNLDIQKRICLFIENYKNPEQKTIKYAPKNALES
jgi:hypothetical protein